MSWLGSYCPWGMNAWEAVISGRSVSPLTARMPQRGRSHLAPHVGRERHFTLTQEEAWPQADIRVLHSPFSIFVRVSEFLHVGRGRDLHLV